ncbi:MAG TPA: glucose-6-phosphate dehydrogenase assembly protein OpcA [bacterium]|nr:glucose-6-phosphate dehydrogenase assembly protein OpcA [bacterium]HPN35817.1 glucose-6-phosphate dehydrogenase assembly protein OpcA [bacterium]
MTETPHWETDGIPTPLPQIESALDEFWRNQAQDGERAVLRSAMSTLILVATGVPRYQSFLQSLPELIRQRPGRIILIRLQPTGETVEAFISAHCRVSSQGGKQLCCEQITLHCPSALTTKLPGIVSPLLLPDLPVLLWWPDAPQAGVGIFSSLCSTIDRLIIQSGAWIAGWRDLCSLAQWIVRHQPQVRIMDLTWASLTGWREALAQFFDAKEGVVLLHGIERIEIQAAPAGFSPAVGWLLAWLATVLQWRLHVHTQPYFTGPAGPIHTSFTAPVAKAVGNSLVTVTLYTRYEGKTVRLHARRINPLEIECRRSDEAAAILQIPLRTETDLLGQELDVACEDELFIRISRFLAQAVPLQDPTAAFRDRGA